MSIRPSGESADYRRGYEDGCADTRGHHDEAAKLRALAKQASPSFRALTDELANNPADAVREAMDNLNKALALCDKSDKLDRERVIGMWAVKHMATIYDRLAALAGAAPVDTGNLLRDPLYLALDALYSRGWTDLHKQRDHDPRGTNEWQAVLDLFREHGGSKSVRVYFRRHGSATEDYIDIVGNPTNHVSASLITRVEPTPPHAPAKAREERVETGRYQFGDDWPGVFLRGDYALPMAMAIRVLLDTGTVDPFAAAQLRGLAKTLESCDARAALATFAEGE